MCPQTPYSGGASADQGVTRDRRQINETKRDAVTEKRWWWPAMHACMHGMGAVAFLSIPRVKELALIVLGRLQAEKGGES
jgi:hypothetical protein